MPQCGKVLSAKEAFQGVSEIKVKSALPGWICLRIAPELESRQPIVDFFRCQMIDLSEDLRDKLTTALDELVSNALEHGCNANPKTGCELTYIRTSRMILIQVRDAGPGFELTSMSHAAVNNPPEDPLRHADLRSQMGMRPGGFGILLVKQIADDLIYNEHGNEVVLVKYL
jgi:anti-sigma regulatory factor (Ser/Thr protein kinase)